MPGTPASPPPAAAPPPEAAHPGAAAPPEDERAAFYALSAELTGFDELELLVTGAGDLYAEWLLRAFPDVTAELLAAWLAIEARSPHAEREAALHDDMLATPRLGPFARAVISLWYTATWSALPDGWSAAYGKRPDDVDRTFGAAVPEALMWRAAVAAHPHGAKPTGFGSWALPPEDPPR